MSKPDTINPNTVCSVCNMRAGSRFAPSQWKMLLQSNIISYCVGANLESALEHCPAKHDITYTITKPDHTSQFEIRKVRYSVTFPGRNTISHLTCRWVIASKTLLPCVSNGVTSFLHWSIDVNYGVSFVSICRNWACKKFSLFLWLGVNYQFTCLTTYI